VTFLGAIVRLRVRLDQSMLLVDAFNLNGASFPERGEAVTVSFSREDLIVLDHQ
jgi:putative spermidine/putrescine transport system ATP-binding protein